MNHTEQIPYDGNEIYELKEEYLERSVKALLGKDEIPVSEIGGRFVSIEVPANTPIGNILHISYKTPDKMVRKFDTDRLRALEELVLQQQEAIKELQEAVRHRMSVRTFTTWAKAVEASLGVQLIEQSFQTPYPE